MNERWRSCCIVALAFACSCTAPTAQPGSGPAPSVPTGALVLAWSIAGTKEPARCTQARAAAIRITVYFGSGGAIAGNFEQSCSSFATRVALAEGTYTGTALLVDDTGAPRTAAMPIASFTIVSTQDYDATEDFPASSFL